MSNATEPTVERRMSGRAFVLLAGGSSVLIGLVILVIALFAGGPTNPDVACQESPDVCVPLRAYAKAWNDRDVEGMAELMTERGLREVLRVGSLEELTVELEGLVLTDIIEELRITAVSLTGDDAAVVRITFSRLNLLKDFEFRLVRREGRWLIDG